MQVDKALAAGTSPRFAAGPPGHEDGLCDTPGKMQPGGLSIWRDIPEGDAAENLADGPDGPAAGQPASFRQGNHQRSRRALERKAYHPGTGADFHRVDLPRPDAAKGVGGPLLIDPKIAALDLGAEENGCAVRPGQGETSGDGGGEAVTVRGVGMEVHRERCFCATLCRSVR